MIDLKTAIISALITACIHTAAQSKISTSRLLQQYLTIQQKRIGFNGVVLVAKDKQILYKECIGKAGTISDQRFQLPEVKKKMTLDGEQLKKFAGSFLSGHDGMELLIIADQNRLFAKLGGKPAFEIYPETPLNFYGRKVNINFTFQANDEGRITRLIADGKSQIISFNKK